jgi:Tfp pilus assembly protein PilO
VRRDLEETTRQIREVRNRLSEAREQIDAFHLSHRLPRTAELEALIQEVYPLSDAAEQAGVTLDSPKLLRTARVLRKLADWAAGATVRV